LFIVVIPILLSGIQGEQSPWILVLSLLIVTLGFPTPQIDMDIRYRYRYNKGIGREEVDALVFFSLLLLGYFAAHAHGNGKSFAKIIWDAMLLIIHKGILVLLDFLVILSFF
ncbi:hypothetical protein ACJX0J_030268, partial [Zea mays]